MQFRILGTATAAEFFRIDKDGNIKLKKSLKEDEAKLTSYIVS